MMIVDPSRFGSAGGGGSDPNFANVVLLLGFNGFDGATATTDESSAGHTLTFNGNAQLDTGQQKFGTASLLLDGTGDYVSSADSADWDLSDANSDEFTIEFWMRSGVNGSNHYPLGQNSGGGNVAWYFTYNSQRMEFAYSTTGAAGGGLTFIQQPASGSGYPMATNTWHFVAVDKDATGKIRLYVDGFMVASATPANSAIFNSTAALEIGRSYAAANFNGHIDELRITKGVARYASDSGFAVPTAAFPRS